MKAAAFDSEWPIPPDEDTLWRTYRAEPSQVLRDRLVTRYLPYARAIAARMYSRRGGQDFEFDDYLQYASLGLMECVDRYQPGLGASFKTYATTRMTGAILNGLEKLTERQQQVAIQRRLALQEDRAASMAGIDEGEESAEDLFRRLAAVGVGVALGVLLEGSGLIEWQSPDNPGGFGAYEQVELKQLRDRVIALVSALPERERHIVRAHYMQDTPFQDIAAEMGVTKGRISQLHKRALDMLRLEFTRYQQSAADF
ncbi:RNA polymerase sigma factor for flagellar operon FliA [Achromobacter deleyi]|uniref:sigma-70 family RNA polymerase sigma factor n=1 Tax=Achromobacter deleyi TaxID=1353891 RepID=UPI00285D0E9A|nr:sigma-70 family RNA polymerase sigma factor [Achromobacter deleyi]MDR6602102.1 RNA polymerase sigma factor for flagellar operon FliA [Achromobacter deleyi]